MKTVFKILSIAAACAAMPVLAQQPKVEAATAVASAPGKGEIARAIRISATVTAVDKASRTVTLKGEDGKEFPVVAGPDVRNFDQIKVGNQVVVGYLQALALELKKGGTGSAPTMSAKQAAGRASAGAQPGGAAARQVTAIADVTAIDTAKQVVTLKGPKRTMDLHVPDANQFKMIAMGDQVQVTYTEAVAVSVEPAAKK